MTDKIKCDECGKELAYLFCKGQNNAYLCGGAGKVPGKCGHNVCFKCDKIETGTE